MDNTNEIQHILLEELKSSLNHSLTESSIEILEKAFHLTYNLSRDKIRASGEEYILHPIRVAQIVMNEIGLGINTVIVAILHDVLKDGLTHGKKIEKEFGEEIANLLNGMIKISSLYTEKLSLQSENFITLLLTISDDPRIILLKLADRLDNIRQIKNFSEEKQFKVAQETRILYAPIAHRLGLYHIKTELEDISLRHVDAENYFNIAGKLKDTKKTREQYIEKFSKPIIELLKEKGYRYDIKGRPKSVNSIYGKLVKKDIDISELFDLFAIRIILNDIPIEKEKEECWNIYSLVTNIYKPNPMRLRDWISTPRPSGYESLHTTVIGPGNHWVEVQIRTHRMDEIAEKGDAAHWKYKEAKSGESNEGWLKGIREILENNNTDSFDELKTKNKKISEIFIFTPNGDIKKLRDGATILDFAYSIHGNIGNTCTGARVNGKIVPIKHKLKSGDTVEIITSKNQKPRTEWLNIVASAKTKTRIKRAINETQFKQAEIGKEMLERKISQLKMEFSDQIILKMINQFKYKRTLDFYQDIADEKIDLQNVKEYLSNLNKETPSKPPEGIEGETLEYIPNKSSSDNYLVIDQDLVNIDYKLARCCRPIPGDPIFGFVTVERGIQIHRKNCPNAKDLYKRYVYRIVPARWTEDSKNSAFLSVIIVTGVDKIGIINHISEVISKHHQVNMRSLNVNSKDGIFQGVISVYVNSISHLDSLLVNINKIKGVLKAERLDKT
ncbi:MAG: bifunctional (p)ppGpp synthetase/guanosine-3',5'-bis(diphosphate) 3'-pyrophosphohydrolase [Salinivirgaceae bacterium]|nr:bifunctional (p)ppGpp synthetase/guanosine-3',5'-bis(diphosphate) 3'-pyrophosphohydrolase [Salinivirgaceae bacterium]